MMNILPQKCQHFFFYIKIDHPKLLFLLIYRLISCFLCRGEPGVVQADGAAAAGDGAAVGS